MSDKFTPSDVPHERYDLILLNHKGETVATRSFLLGFDGIGEHGKWSSDEEYSVSIKAREMYRDAAYAAGKWPTREQLIQRYGKQHEPSAST